MVLEKIQQQLEASQTAEGFLYPDYHGYCFSNIPKAILWLLGAEQKNNPLLEIFQAASLESPRPQRVVLILIDGFGYKQWLQCGQDYQFFQQMNQKSVLAPLTAVFPSTTSAALTTISSGLTPKEHGLLEWWVYFQELGEIITTLPFTLIGEEGRDTLLKKNIDPKILFNSQTIYQALQQAGVPSFVFTRDTYAKSVYSKLAHEGSEVYSFINSSDLMVNLRQKLQNNPKGYFYVYWDCLDSLAHCYGPKSQQYLAELNTWSHLLQTELLEKITPAISQDIALIITADHGQVATSPQETIYLNKYPEVVNNLQRSPAGKKILPWGSCRDVFLAIEDDKLAEVADFLKRILQNQALVIETKEAVRQGLFGVGWEHPQFKSRAGNLLILPYYNQTIWYEHFEGKKYDKNGMHGGLTPEEMLVPLAVARLSALF